MFLYPSVHFRLSTAEQFNAFVNSRAYEQQKKAKVYAYNVICKTDAAKANKRVSEKVESFAISFLFFPDTVV